MTKLLAFDTTTQACSVAIAVEGKISSRYECCQQKHGEILLAMIQELLTAHQLTLADLNALAFSHGPGSFTGIRIAMSVMQALAMSLSLPVISVSSLYAIAVQASQNTEQEHIIAAIDARMAEVYFAAYQVDQAIIIEDSLLKPHELPDLFAANWYGVGDAWNIYANEFKQKYGSEIRFDDSIYPHAEVIAKIALDEYQKGNTLSYDEIVPNYLRNKVTN